MINDGPLRRFDPLANDLVKPFYADYTFGNIANTIHYLLAGEHLGPLLPPDCFGGQYPHPNKVVLLFIDSFGWELKSDEFSRVFSRPWRGAYGQRSIAQ